MKKLQKIATSIRWFPLLGALVFFGVSCFWLFPATALAATPNFEEIVVADNLEDGYWVEAFDVNNDSRPDLVTSGLAVGEVAWYENPGDFTPQAQWTKHVMATFPKPVALDHTDIDDDGWIDVVISHDYGSCMFDCSSVDGKISWLKNPADSHLPWTKYHIGDLVATHRLVFGQFTPSEKLELLALPVVGPPVPPFDETENKWQSPIHVTLYTRPELADLYTATEWPTTLINDSYYHIIHGVKKGKFDANTNSNLDSVLLASQEGVSWLYYNQGNQWEIVPLAVGDLDQTVEPDTQDNDHQFTGSGNVDIGNIGTDLYGYIATLEPFHGNKVAVYTKNVEADLAKMRWKRTELDVLGYTNKNGEGAGHHLKTADFDGDGEDEFIIAERGPTPFQGVFYYDRVQQEDSLRPTITFKRDQVSFSSAARIALEDFDGDGKLDFATTGYYTPGYFLADNPQVLVFLNRID
ncbi:MAG: FG-GAP repeat domain-containing protein [Crocosphaera sp.]